MSPTETKWVKLPPTARVRVKVRVRVGVRVRVRVRNPEPQSESAVELFCYPDYRIMFQKSTCRPCAAHEYSIRSALFEAYNFEETSCKQAKMLS